MGATSAGIETKLIARSRSDFANVRTRVILPTGTIIDPPIPCKIRHATNASMLLEMPQRNNPSVNNPIAAAKTLRVPNRSATHPLIGIKTARLRV